MPIFNRYYVSLLAGCLHLWGCATVFNGSDQEVPIKVPTGTVISYYNGALLPIGKTIADGGTDTVTFISLRRREEQTLRFLYRQKEALITIPRSIDAGWIGADFFFYVAPLLVDAMTGAWYSFDGIAVHFPDDTTSGSSTRPVIESYEPNKLFKKKLDIIALASIGYMGPTYDIFLPLIFVNEFLFGLGYEFSKRFSMIAEWNFASKVNFLRARTKYSYDHSHLSTYQLQGRYMIAGGFFGAIGGGLGSASVDHIWYFDDNNIRHLFSGISQTFPTAFAAIGFASKGGYFELRHTQGFGSFSFPNGEPFEPAATSFNFGFNFHF